MATTSTQVISQVNSQDLDVLSTYRELMKASTDKDSIYIKAKESLLSYFSEPDNTLSEREKSEMLVNLISSMSVQITTASMSTAVEIAKENRDSPYVLTKLQEDTKLVQEQADKVAADNLVATANAEKINKDTAATVIQGWKVQTDMVRENGVTAMPTTTTNPVFPVETNIADKGLKWENEQQTKMSVYATLAKSYRDSGVVSWTTDELTGKINAIADLSPTTPGLIKAQEKVAIRQEIGFDDNKLQHAANSSATYMSMLHSSNEAGLIDSADVALWRSAVGKLNTPSTPTPEAIAGSVTVTTFADGDTVSKAAGVLIEGTTSNVLAGTPISVVMYTGEAETLKASTRVSDLVQVDGSWSLNVAVSDIDNLDLDTGTISITLVDSTGLTREDPSISTVVIGA